MRRKVISSATLLSVLLSTILSLSAISSGIGIAKADSVIATISQQPPDTTITSAVDDNGITLANGSSTLSTSIHISFTGKAGSNNIAGFQCSLDNSPFSSCSSPAVFNNLAAGPHKFVVVAVDTAGNKDPNPATFSWTIAPSVVISGNSQTNTASNIAQNQQSVIQSITQQQLMLECLKLLLVAPKLH
jgi:hypothetical protein